MDGGGWRLEAGLAALALIAIGCGDGARACRVPADCASGVCRSDGTCAPATSSSSSGGSTGTLASDTGGSGSSTASSSTSGTTGAGSATGTTGSSTTGSTGSGFCRPDGDDHITALEMPLQAGLHATFRIAQNATWNTAGTALPDGGTGWDLTGALSGDQDVLVTTNSLTGQWFATDFPNATYTSQLSNAQDLLGVFEVTSAGLFLQGVVSPASGLYQTELTYDPPVQVLAFPLTPGASWSTSSTVSGQAQGTYLTYFEDYQSTVDKQGSLATPYAAFPVMRVATDLTRTVGAVVTTTRTFTFATDCFGAVAVVTSQPNETQSEFSSLSEARRLAP